MTKKLKYYDLRYSYVHGGKNYKSRSSGKRSTKTFQKQCPFSVSFRLSGDGNHIIISKLHLGHGGHDTSREYGNLLRTIEKYAENMLAMGSKLK